MRQQGGNFIIFNIPCKSPLNTQRKSPRGGRYAAARAFIFKTI